MRKYTVRVVSTEVAYAEVLANSDKEAIEKAQDVDWDELDWAAGDNEYDIAEISEEEYAEPNLFDKMKEAIQDRGFKLVKDISGQLTLEVIVCGHLASWSLPICLNPEELKNAVTRLANQFSPSQEALKLILRVSSEEGEGEAAAIVSRVYWDMNEIRSQLYAIADDLWNILNKGGR